MASCILRASTPAFSTLALPDFRFDNMSSDSRLLDWGGSSSSNANFYPERFGVVETTEASNGCRLQNNVENNTRSLSSAGPMPCKIEPDVLMSPDFSHATLGPHQQFMCSTSKLGTVADSSFPKSKEPVFLSSSNVDYQVPPKRPSSTLKRPLPAALEVDIPQHLKDKNFDTTMASEAIASSLQSVQDGSTTAAGGSPLCSSPSKLPEPDHEVHIWTERERRKKMRSMFVTLHSMLPKVPSKADKSTIVDEAINYIKSLEQKMQRLQKKKSEKVQAGGYLHSEIAARKPKIVLDSDIQVSQQSCDSSFRTLSSANVVFNVCGADAFITICAGARPNLLSRIFTCVIQSHKLDVKNVQITDASDNRRVLIIHASATDVARTSDGDLRNVMQDLIRCI